MMWRDLFEETFAALSANKVRSGLTMLGIIIGISSVIAMVAIGQGAQKSIQDSIQSIGSNLIMVTPGAQRSFGGGASAGRGSAKSLTLADADAITTSVTDASAVAPEVSGRYQVAAKGKNTNTQIVGTVPAYAIVRNVQVETGTFITDQHIRTGAKVAVLGPTAATDLFGDGADPIGQTVRINKVVFTIVGVTKAKGGSGFSNPDDQIFVPISASQRYLSGDQYVTTISVAAKDATSTAAVQAAVTDLLLTRHHISDPTLADFSTLNQADIVATASSVTGIFTVLLGSVAGISLVVGGIGIMNMMLTTVTERMREIGLRKAVGAKRHEVSRQFLMESVVLTCLGGSIGVLLGWGIASLVTALGLVSTQVTWQSVLLAFGVSAGIGIAFGYYPARRAAGLNPIEALRYE